MLSTVSNRRCGLQSWEITDHLHYMSWVRGLFFLCVLILDSPVFRELYLAYLWLNLCASPSWTFLSCKTTEGILWQPDDRVTFAQTLVCKNIFTLIWKNEFCIFSTLLQGRVPQDPYGPATTALQSQINPLQRHFLFAEGKKHTWLSL